MTAQELRTVFLHLLDRPLHNFIKCNIVDKVTFQQNREMMIKVVILLCHIVDYVMLEIYFYISFQWIIASGLRNVIFKIDCKQVVDDIHAKSIRSKYDSITDDYIVIFRGNCFLMEGVVMATP